MLLWFAGLLVKYQYLVDNLDVAGKLDAVYVAPIPPTMIYCDFSQLLQRLPSLCR